jgi:Bacterial extracellular solute-binding protein
VLAEVGAQFERTAGYRLDVSSDLSSGFARRLAAGEPVDVVISASSSIDDWITQGRIMAEPRTDLARSGIGVEVREGQPGLTSAPLRLSNGRCSRRTQSRTPESAGRRAARDRRNGDRTSQTTARFLSAAGQSCMCGSRSRGARVDARRPSAGARCPTRTELKSACGCKPAAKRSRRRRPRARSERGRI